MSKLKDYLDKHDIPVADFAAAINVHVATAYRYVNGRRIPDPEVLLRIVEWSDRELTPNDLYGIPAPSESEGAAA
jgi:transcriptional regulator with XRE-family HTH domain